MEDPMDPIAALQGDSTPGLQPGEAVPLQKITKKIAVFFNCHNMTVKKCIFARRTIYPAFLCLVGGWRYR